PPPDIAPSRCALEWGVRMGAMTVDDGSKELRAPDGFGAAASSIAFFPALMGGYAVFYAAWWPFAWGWAGAVAFILVLIAAAIAIVRGVTQIRHAAGFPKESAPDVDRLD